MLIGDVVYEVESETGEVMYDLPMGTVADFYWDEEVGETRFRVRWDGDTQIDNFGYYSYQLRKVTQCLHGSQTDR